MNAEGPDAGPSVPAQRGYAAHECRVSVTRSHSEGSRRDGRCTWCHRRFEGPAPEPRMARGYMTEAERSYRYMYDPNWGLDPRDV